MTWRVRLGICIEDAWRYMGLSPPPSIRIPHILKVQTSSRASRIKEALEKIRPHRRIASLDSATGLAELLKESGIRRLRFWLQWSFIQPKLTLQSAEPRYDWLAMDDFVKTLKGSGIKLFPVVGCGYQRMLPQGVYPAADPDSYIRAVSEFTREAVARYKRVVDMWQIENEPNWWFAHYLAGWRSGHVWIGYRPKFRKALISSLSEAVSAEDGNALTVINLEADRSLRDLDFYARYCDVLGLDYYPNYSHARPVDASGLVPKARKVSEETGKRVIVCETGYPSGPALLGFDQTLQSLYIERLREALRGESVVEELYVWRLSDPGWKSFPDHENHFGLLDGEGKPKRSWWPFISWVKEAD
ncbi:MAG: hypothetical protein QW390_00725 [Candidatus Bathyarchaeia archaeon]